MELLAPRFHVLAADAYGAGKSPAWPADRAMTLHDEMALLEPVLERAGRRFSLVGHSYGGALALVVALARPERVRCLALYEPTLFSLVEQVGGAPNDVDGIRRAVADCAGLLRSGDGSGAARRFIDFWMGEGSFERMPERSRAVIAESVRNVEGWKHALFEEPTPADAFRALQAPVLLLVGARSPLSSRAVAERLGRLLPRFERIDLEGLGHMAPVTHADAVNARLAAFLDRHGR